MVLDVGSGAAGSGVPPQPADERAARDSPPTGPRRTRLGLPALTLLGELLDGLPLPVRSPVEDRRRLASRMGAPVAVLVPPDEGPDPREELERLGVVSGDGPVHRAVALALSTVALGTVHLDASAEVRDADGATARLLLWAGVSGGLAAVLSTDDGAVFELSACAADDVGGELLRRLPAPSVTAPPASAEELLLPWDAFVEATAAARRADPEALQRVSREVQAARPGLPAAVVAQSVEGLVAALCGRLRLRAYGGQVDDVPLDDDLVHAPGDVAASWLLVGTAWHAVTERAGDAALQPVPTSALPAVVDGLLRSASRR